MNHHQPFPSRFEVGSSQLGGSQFGALHFGKYMREAYLRDAWRKLRGRRCDLVKFDDVARRLGIHPHRAPHPAEVPVNRIVGTVGRAKEFTREFLPRSVVNAERWQSVARAMQQGAELPPIELYRIGDAYFVIDGHHRTSVARAQGRETVDAYVSTLDSPVWLSAEDFHNDTWVEKIASQGQEEAMFSLLEDQLIKQWQEERLEWFARERLARLAQAQRTSWFTTLRQWAGEQLIRLGNRLKNPYPFAANRPGTTGEA